MPFWRAFYSILFCWTSSRLRHAF